MRAALDGITHRRADCSGRGQAIALMMREALETPDRTAALVCLTGCWRGVSQSASRAEITVDDSPAGRSPRHRGAFLDLVAAAVGSHFAPADVMALLKHPLTRLGLPVRDARRAARTLQLAAMRTIYLGEGQAGSRTISARRGRGRVRRERAAAPVACRLGAAADLVTRLRAAMEPMTVLMSASAPAPLHALVTAHRAAAEAIARGADDSAPALLWQGEDGEEADRLLASLADDALPAPDIDAADYPDFYRTLATSVTVRPRVAVHPRLSIWGPYEARLQQPDLVILGSLNEGTWPAAADPGAWLNRPMRAKLGLPAPEEAIGRAAHDLTGLLGAREVVLTRANRVDGAPTVPSRWLMRIDALLGGLGLSDALAAKRPWLAWARARDGAAAQSRPFRHRAAAHPASSPAAAQRVDIELWITVPTASTRHILGLRRCPRSARHRGRGRRDHHP